MKSNNEVNKMLLRDTVGKNVVLVNPSDEGFKKELEDRPDLLSRYSLMEAVPRNTGDFDYTLLKGEFIAKWDLMLSGHGGGGTIEDVSASGLAKIVGYCWENRKWIGRNIFLNSCGNETSQAVMVREFVNVCQKVIPQAVKDAYRSMNISNNQLNVYFSWMPLTFGGGLGIGEPEYFKTWFYLW